MFERIEKPAFNTGMLGVSADAWLFSRGARFWPTLYRILTAVTLTEQAIRFTPDEIAMSVFDAIFPRHSARVFTHNSRGYLV